MDSFKAFKEKLDNEHKWPAIYMFKFVAPSAKVQDVLTAFSKETFQMKRSKAGNYVAFTLKKMIKSSDEVVEIYLKARKIEGLIAM
ncbi:MAG: DUF493 family protein [Cyclobacteriaceae bacterium]|nr:DUF493 family protein [Cyclobacteriaceae bacterium]